MTLRTRLWFTMVGALVPICLLFGMLFVGSVVPAVTAYPLAAQTAAAGAWVMVFPWLALSCAVVARRLVNGGKAGVVPSSRAAWWQVLTNIAPGALAATGVLLVVTATYSAQHGVLAWPPALLVVSTLMAATMYALLGFALGSHLRLIIAAPLAVLTPYLLVAFPPAMEPVWLRHLFLISSNCCTVAQVLSLRAVGANMLLSASLGCLLLWLAGKRFGAALPTGGAVTATSVIGLVAALGLAHGLSATAVDARGSGMKCSATSGFELCLWPEHESGRPQARALLARVREADPSARVATARRLTEAFAPTSTDGVLSLEPAAQPSTSRGEVLGSLAPRPTAQCLESVRQSRRADRELYWSVNTFVGAWWAQRIGAEVDLGGAIDPTGMSASLARVSRMSLPEQESLVSQIVRAIPRCEPLPTI